MRFENVAIVGLETVNAPHAVSSSTLMERLSGTFQHMELRPDLLENVAGIRSRHFWDEGTAPSDAATLAATKVLNTTGVPKENLQLLINASVCRDYLEPSTACIVHGNLGLSLECQSFDLGNACLAFVNAMDVAANMIERGAIKNAIIVDGETSRLVTEKTIERLNHPDATEQDVREQFAALTLGSGSVAMIMGHADDYPDCTHRYLGGVSLAATQHSKLCRGNMDWMVTDTRKLLFAGIELASMTWIKAQRELGWSADVLDELVLHQVSKVHTQSLLNALQLDMERSHLIFPEYGNLGPASVPFVLSQSAELGRIQEGSRVALMGIGSGLNCTMAEVLW